MEHFNNPFSRLNTHSKKWYHPSLKDREDILSFSIADSDYPTAKEIIDAIVARTMHGAFGYTYVDAEYKTIIKDWVQRRYNYTIKEEWIIGAPKVVTALYFLIDALTCTNAKIVIQPPVYTPFFEVIKNNNRIVLENHLINNDNYYSIDFVDLEKKFQEGVEMIIFCSPHNPVGRVYNYQEVEKLVKLCKQYNVILVSDEIHCDIILNNNKFVSVGEFLDIYDNIIIVTAPSKTFNLAGLHAANIFISNDKVREVVKKSFIQKNIGHNIIGITACKAAYSKCDYWVDAQNKHIENNFKILKEYFETNIPKAKVTSIEGTYLVWIDMSFLKLSSDEIYDGLLEKGIIINKGSVYSDKCENFIRINIACSSSQLLEGLNRINEYVKEKEL